MLKQPATNGLNTNHLCTLAEKKKKVTYHRRERRARGERLEGEEEGEVKGGSDKFYFSTDKDMLANICPCSETYLSRERERARERARERERERERESERERERERERLTDRDYNGLHAS